MPLFRMEIVVEFTSVVVVVPVSSPKVGWG